mgnify:CR=1 FL=1
MINFVILASGEFPTKQQNIDLLMNADKLICCDGAVDDLVKYREPDYIAGDMDSISSENREKFSNIIFPEDEQEDNDLTKAIRLAIKIASESSEPFYISILGATGKREDHTLGNISLLARYNRMLKETFPSTANYIQMISDRGRFIPLDDSCEIETQIGTAISIFATDPTLKISTQGVKYPTDEVVFDQWSWWKATLNVTTQKSVKFTFNHPCDVLVYIASNI